MRPCGSLAIEARVCYTEHRLNKSEFVEVNEIWNCGTLMIEIQGVTLVRGEVIPEGFFHLVCEIIVRHIDGSYLIMQRDKRKHLGGMWEATAGGSALQGEEPAICAARELYEETGITSNNLIEIGRVLHHSHNRFMWSIFALRM